MHLFDFDYITRGNKRAFDFYNRQYSRWKSVFGSLISSVLKEARVQTFLDSPRLAIIGVVNIDSSGESCYIVKVKWKISGWSERMGASGITRD